MGKIIYIIRHGESQSQTAECLDEINPDLSERGISQAKRLQPLLANCHPDLILTSTMQRAWKTMLHSQIKAAKVRFDSRLVESYPAERYQGREFEQSAEVAEADVHNAYAWVAADRVQHLWNDMQTMPYQKIMCFCHWNTASHLLRAILGLGADNYISYAQMDNAAVSVCEYTKQPALRVWNYTEHLHGLLENDPVLSFLRT